MDNANEVEVLITTETTEAIPAVALTVADDNLFDTFLADYAPPVEPFAITMPKGQALMFKAFQSDSELEACKREGKRQLEIISKRIGPIDVLKVAGTPERNGSAWFMFSAMVGWYVDSDSLTEPGVTKYIGDLKPKWTFAQWLKLAKEAPMFFDGLVRSFDVAQERGKSRAESEAIDREKKS